MHNDHAWHRALDLFKASQIDEGCEKKVFNERVYLAYYAESVIEQFSLHSEMKEAVETPQKREYGCGHTTKKFINVNQGMANDNMMKNEKNDMSTTAIQQQLQNFQTFRLMWSKNSKIMSIHMVNLNPFQIQFVGSKKRALTENYETIYNHTYEPIISEQSKAVKCKCLDHCNKLAA